MIFGKIKLAIENALRIPAEHKGMLIGLQAVLDIQRDMEVQMLTLVKLLERLIPPVVEPPDPIPMSPDWSQVPPEDLPAEWQGFPVRYVVMTRETPLWKPIGKDFDEHPELVFSQCKEFGGTNIYQRTIARQGKVLQIFLEGDQWALPEGHNKEVTRAWQVDGGGFAYRLTPWQRVDGRDLVDHPDPVLMVRLEDCVLYPSADPANWIEVDA